MTDRFRRSELARIHIAKSQLRIPDDAYRAMVQRMTDGRTNSAGEMNRMERSALLAEFKAAGWVLIKSARARPGRVPSKDAMDRQTMLTRVEQLLADQQLPWAYAEAILRKQRGVMDKTVACPLSAATDPELRGVIAALYRRGHKSAPKRSRA